MKIAVILLATVPLATSVKAQWVNHPTPGIPRTPDGKPNLSAPAPRTADGKPDLSGMWAATTEVIDRGPLGPTATPSYWLDLGPGVRGGLPYQPWAGDLRKARFAANSKDHPMTQCLPLSIVLMHSHPLSRKVIQVPGLVGILSEYNMMFRQIFTDGRPLPVDPQPSFNGYSVGKWDGDALVVETSGFKDGLWLDGRGSPSTDAARVTERFRRVDFGTLEIEITVQDPKAYTMPWSVKVTQSLMADTDLLEFVCLENEKDRSHMVGK